MAAHSEANGEGASRSVLTLCPLIALWVEVAILKWPLFRKGSVPTLLALAIQMAGAADLNTSREKVCPKAGDFLGWTFFPEADVGLVLTD